MKLLGALAIGIGASVAVAALLGFVDTPWITIGMTLFGIALLVLHKRRPLRIRKGDLEATMHQPHRND